MERCVTCHVKEDEDPGGAHARAALGCASCHLGNPLAFGKERAHAGLEREPGALSTVGQTCGRADCHAREAARVATSPMTRNAGIVAVDRFTFGEIGFPRWHGVDGGRSRGREPVGRAVPSPEALRGLPPRNAAREPRRPDPRQRLGLRRLPRRPEARRQAEAAPARRLEGAGRPLLRLPRRERTDRAELSGPRRGREGQALCARATRRPPGRGHGLYRLPPPHGPHGRRNRPHAQGGTGRDHVRGVPRARAGGRRGRLARRERRNQH